MEKIQDNTKEPTDSGNGRDTGSLTIGGRGNNDGEARTAVAASDSPSEVPANNFLVSAKVNCTVTERSMNDWRMEAYNQLTQAYESWLEQYNADMTRLARDGQGTNDALLGNIEFTSLRAEIEAYLYALKFEPAGSTEAEETTEEEDTIDQPAYDQFFNEVFEWGEMSYTFNDSPAQLSFKQQGSDDSLRPFLQAKSARILIPVAPEFNAHVLNYLTAGVIWTTQWPFVPIFESDVRFIRNFKKTVDPPPVCRTEKWEISAPTFMEVIENTDATMFKK